MRIIFRVETAWIIFHAVYDKQVVIIFDECHRSQFGDMHAAIVRSFKKYYMFGFTGTPIFPANSGTVKNPKFFTTEQTFGDQLHTYTIVDAINDKNVLPFRVDYIKTMDTDADIDDEQVWDIDRKKAFEAPERIALVTKYILEHFDQKTYRGDKTYVYNALTNIAEVASADRGKVEEIKQKQRISGFNSIFAVSSVPMAKLYYDEFRRQIKADPTKNLKIAVIYSYGANEEEADGILDEENPEDTSALDQTARDFLDSAILDYNQMFHTNYDTASDKFQNYYKDISLRMKNKELDLLIVVNMFLTGFDATTLNTLWVDKNLKMHGLIQAFSRTNRILNSIKTFGNIVCFRNLQKRVDAAISLFGDKNAGGIVLMKSFKDYYYGYESVDGKQMPGYVDMIEELNSKFPLIEPQIIGEQNQKDFITLFGAILRMRNLLLVFDEFAGKECITERNLQDYLGKYQDLRDEWKRKRENGESVDIIDDIVFEVELIKQIEINIDYILMLVKKYHDTHGEDKEVLITIRKAIDASPELRSKKALIETFISGINDMDDVMIEWQNFIVMQREKDLCTLIKEEKLKPEETRKFIENCFREGEVKTTGTEGIPEYQEDVSFWLDLIADVDSEEKKNILQNMFDKTKVSLIYGAAGTGKTYLINHIANYMREKSILFLANTNPAVENLRRKVTAIDPQKCEFMTIKKFLMSRYNRTDYDILVMDECSMVSNSDMADIIDKISCEIMILVGDTYQIESITFGNWFSMAKYFVPAYAWNELEKPYRTKDEHLLEFWRKVRNLDDDLTEYIVNHRYSTSLDSSVFDKKSADEIILCLNYDGLYGM